MAADMREAAMFFLALAAVISSTQPGQILAGASFERFAIQADRSCPARQLRKITPGNLSWEQEQFEDRLSPVQKQRLAAVDRTPARCAGRDGLSCPTTQMLAALHRANLLRPFTAFACSHPQP